MKKKIVSIFVLTLLIAISIPIVNGELINQIYTNESIEKQILDQGQENDDEKYYITSGEFQGFVPQKEKLEYIEVKIGHWAAEFSSPEITLTLEKPLGNVITSTTVSTTDIPNIIETNETDWIIFDVDDVDLIIGETYLLVLNFNTDADFAWSGAFDDPYPEAGSSLFADWDFCFRTFVKTIHNTKILDNTLYDIKIKGGLDVKADVESIYAPLTMEDWDIDITNIGIGFVTNGQIDGVFNNNTTPRRKS